MEKQMKNEDIRDVDFKNVLDKDIKVNFSEEEMVFIHFFRLEINWMAQFPHKACVLKIWERR